MCLSEKKNEREIVYDISNIIPQQGIIATKIKYSGQNDYFQALVLVEMKGKKEYHFVLTGLHKI